MHDTHDDSHSHSLATIASNWTRTNTAWLYDDVAYKERPNNNVLLEADKGDVHSIKDTYIWFNIGVYGYWFCVLCLGEMHVQFATYYSEHLL